ncbi:MAG: hypothetical protein R2716_12455 [Microthrixaceae bacterium]
MPTRWFNSRLPQTLVVAQFLLYFDAFFALLAVISGAGLGLLGVLVILGSVYGAAGIASEMRNGYYAAIAVSFLPLALRLIVSLGAAGGLLGNLPWVLLQVGAEDPRLGSDLIGAMFQYALIVVLLHSQSREHTRIWFS